MAALVLMHLQQSAISLLYIKCHFHHSKKHSIAAVKADPGTCVLPHSPSRKPHSSRKPPAATMPAVPPWRPGSAWLDSPRGYPSRCGGHRSQYALPLRQGNSFTENGSDLFNKGNSSDEGQLFDIISLHFSRWKHLNSSVESASFPWKLLIL